MHIVGESEIKLRLELRKLELEADREQKEADRAAELKKLEMQAEREREREIRNHELEMKKLEYENRRAEAASNSPRRSDNEGFDVTKNVRLVPPFDEDKVENFFQCFENVAENCSWRKESWATMLFGVLKGKAHNVYSALRWTSDRIHTQTNSDSTT